MKRVARVVCVAVGIGATLVAYSAGAALLSKIDIPEKLPIEANIIVGSLSLAYATWSLGTYWKNPLRDFGAIKNECMRFTASVQEDCSILSLVKSSARFSFWTPLMAGNALLRPLFTVGAYGVFFVCFAGLMNHQQYLEYKRNSK